MLGPVALRVADAVGPVEQLLLGHPKIAVEVVPGSEPGRRRREFIAESRSPEVSQPVRVGTVDDQLKADRHVFLPRCAGSYRAPGCVAGTKLRCAASIRHGRTGRCPRVLTDERG